MGLVYDLAVVGRGINGTGIACDWTGSVPLPDGEFGRGKASIRPRKRQRATRFLGAEKAQRLTGLNAAYVSVFLGQASAFSDLGENFLHGLCAAETVYPIAHLWVQAADDLLCRRTKFGLHSTAEGATCLNRCIIERMANT